MIAEAQASFPASSDHLTQALYILSAVISAGLVCIGLMLRTLWDRFTRSQDKLGEAVDAMKGLASVFENRIRDDATARDKAINHIELSLDSLNDKSDDILAEVRRA